jgi:hypothetical protein
MSTPEQKLSGLERPLLEACIQLKLRIIGATGSPGNPIVIY